MYRRRAFEIIEYWLVKRSTYILKARSCRLWLPFVTTALMFTFTASAHADDILGDSGSARRPKYEGEFYISRR